MKRNPLILIFLLFCTQVLFSQNDLEKAFYFRSASLGIGIANGSEESGYLDFKGDITTAYYKNLFSLAVSAGGTGQSFGSSRDFLAVDLLYGRAFEINNFFTIEGHAGVGYFFENYKDYDTNFAKEKESTIGIPLQAKLLFYVSPKFALGLNPSVNFNSIETIYSGNLIFQYNFGGK